MTDAAWLRAMRDRLGLTQADLAAQIHVTQATVSRIESGEIRLTPRTRAQVEQLLREVEVSPPA